MRMRYLALLILLVSGSYGLANKNLTVIDSESDGFCVTLKDDEGCVDELLPFKCVVDTLNSAEVPIVHSDYFLYDITGDGQPEFWVIHGSCEADKELWVYAVEDGLVKKIFSGDGGHIEFFLNGDVIGCAVYNTGSGYVGVYDYEGGKMKIKTADFSMFNENGEARALKKRKQKLVDLWVNSDCRIPLVFIK